jgi:hypothetical protein
MKTNHLIVAYKCDGQPDWVPLTPFVIDEIPKGEESRYLKFGDTYASRSDAQEALGTMPLDEYGKGDLFALAKWNREQMGTQKAFEEFSNLVDNFDKIYPHR